MSERGARWYVAIVVCTFLLGAGMTYAPRHVVEAVITGALIAALVAIPLGIAMMDM